VAVRGPVRGSIFFLNVSGKYRDKANEVLDVFNRHPRIVTFLRGRPCAIELIPSTDDNPASVTTGKRAVHVEVATWYFENYSVGEIVGMLNHEFGIHPVADEALNEVDRPSRFDIGTPQAPRLIQIDHIEGTALGSPRADVYMAVVLQSAVLLPPDEAKKALYVYLMDVATIAATNDRRKDALKSPDDAYKVYRATRVQLEQAIMQKYAGRAGAIAHLLAALPDDKDFSIKNDFLRAGLHYMKSRGSKSSIASDEKP
jgi:hypothetical protein